MFAINGTDYTLSLFEIIIVTLVFAVQYILCSKAKRIGVKLIPVYGILLLIILAILVATSDNRGSFIDLRGGAALLVLGFALICSISTGAAWAIYKARNKR